MAGSRKGANEQTRTGGTNGSHRTSAATLMNPQEVADLVRSTAERAAERFPQTMSDAQTVARDTQRALEQLPSETLYLGTGFSLGLAVGLYLHGSNRALVLLALTPAIAMAGTLLGRDSSTRTD
jgi:hypothetical protein